ncbi:MAG: polymer-forming cytoskeletal protein, partial [Acidimicrobiia bacterium]|nr:polymer-forming cytoskeletal protein [Acidimicrobiia bacterium]
MSSRAERLSRLRPKAPLILVLLIFTLTPPAWALTTQSSLVLIRSEDVVEEDLYALGQRVQIDGTIEGDLVALGVEEVRVNGTVTGSVIAGGAAVVIDGSVGGSVRAVAGTISVAGGVEGDVFGAGWRLAIDGPATVGRDVVVAAWRAMVEGVVGRDLHGRYRTIELSGTVDENVEIDAGSMTVTERAAVGDDLAVRSRRSPAVDSAADIGGEVLDRRPLSPNVRVTGFVLLFRILAAIGTALAGLALLWNDAAQVARAAARLRAHPIRVTATGLLTVAAPFVIVALLFGIVGLMPPGAALPLVGFAVPVSIGLLTIALVASLLAPLPSAVALGS